MQEEQIIQIAFSRLYRNRIRKALTLLEHYGTASAVWTHIDEPEKKTALQRAEEECAFIEKYAIDIAFCTDDKYPYRLRECPDHPLLLYSRGKVQMNTGKFVSIVGTRNATDRGKELTKQFVRDLTQQIPNVTIISGLAYGIDIAAHRAALEMGVPTLIVPAHGLDRIYPAQHRNEAVAALTQGGILTEYMSRTNPDKQNFVARNRIVAGLADAVVVVESHTKGGSLITAQMACDYNRDLFAFPGRPSDENARGCNDLIRRQKAQLIESADDLIRYMQWDVKQQKTPIQTELVDLFASLTPTQQSLLDKLHEDDDGVHINLLVMETGLGYAEAAADLMLMEMDGIVKALPGGIYRALK